MTNSIVINDKSRTIEITKKFAAAAKNFGSQEYEDLQRARSHYAFPSINNKGGVYHR